MTHLHPDIVPGFHKILKHQVTENDLASFFGKDHMPVMATGKIVAIMEFVALDMIHPLLDNSQTSVGVSISLEHIKPVKPGLEISIEARIEKVSKRYIDYEISLSNNGDILARASHRRAVISMEVFRRSLL